jgi:hypothetical protein
MSAIVSVRLDDAAQVMLEREAKVRQLGLSAAIRELATEAARQAKRKRIREGSARVARHIAENPEAAEFNEFWTTPHIEGL